MPEMRSDMLPDPEPGEVEKKPVEDTPPKPVEPEPVAEKKGEPTPPPVTTHDIPSGFVPYQSLDMERMKRKEAERELRELKAQHSSPEPSDISEEDFSEEGKLLKRENDDLKSRLDRIENSNRLATIVGKYPNLVDKMDEFDKYRATRSNLTVEEAADVFVAANGLAENKPARKGLETPNGGDKTGSDTGYTAADVERLRTTDYRRYEKLLRAGAFDNMQ